MVKYMKSKEVSTVLAVCLIAFCSAGVSIIPGCNLFSGKDGGIYKSTDYGLTYASKSLLATGKNLATRDVQVLVMDPQSPATLYWGTDDGLYRSIDGAETWRSVLSKVNVTGVAVDPADPTRVYVATTGGGTGRLYVQEEGGVFSEKLVSAEGQTALQGVAIDSFNSRVIYTIAENGNVFRSDDRGDTWSVRAKLDERPQKLIISPADTQTMYLIGKSNLWKSTDTGVNWISLDDSIKTALGRSAEVNDLDIDPQSASHILIATTGGLAQSTDGGVSWTKIQTLLDPSEAKFWAVAIDPAQASRFYYSANGAVHRSEDGGLSWTPRLMPGDRSVKEILINPKTPSDLFIGLAQ